MSVVVTGAAGFVGRVLVASLTARGEQVVALDRRAVTPAPGVVPLLADIVDDDPRVPAALRAADAVFHLAGAPGVRDASPEAGTRRHRDNVRAAARVLAAVPLATPLVVTSSSSVYGGAHGRASRESDPVAPRGGYAHSKVAVEALCARRLDAGGRTVVARPFTLVGEGQRGDMAVARWLAAARAARPLTVLGGLDRTRDFTDVRLAAQALADLAGTPGSDGFVNVGSGRPQSLREVLAAVAGVTGRRLALRVLPAADEEPADTWACTERLDALVGRLAATDLVAVVARAAGADLPATVSAPVPAPVPA